MSARRVLRAAEAIRQVVSTAILTELRDPRVAGVTVTFVEVSTDLRNAKVHVSVMGDEKAQAFCIKGLESAGGFLQGRVGDRIETRYTPRLQFILDKGVKNSADVVKILEEVLPPEKEPEKEPHLSADSTLSESSDPPPSSDLHTP